MIDPAPSADLQALVGSTVGGKYRIARLIGLGGMGAVFEATNERIGKRVALKFLNRQSARDLDAARRFQREAQAASTIESAHIVQIFDAGATADEVPFLVMELLQGEDLRAQLDREGRLDIPTARHVVLQVLRGLASAHASGIIHRDLKPENVFLCRRDDDPLFVKLVDFGISKLAPALAPKTLTTHGTVMGTAAYMSPEQAQALEDIDVRTDLYSVGAILYEALTGRPAHDGPTYEAVLINLCTTDAPDVRELAPEVPAELASVVARALKRDRSERFESAEAFYSALAATGLDRAASESQERKRAFGAAPATTTAHLRAFRAGVFGRAAWVLAVLAGLALTALAATLWEQRTPLPEPASPTPPQPRATQEQGPEPPSVRPSTQAASDRAANDEPGPEVSKPEKARPAPPPAEKRGVAGGLKLNTEGP